MSPLPSPPPPAPDRSALWARIRAFPLDDPHAQFAFWHRLARENDWSYPYTLGYSV